MWVPSFIQVCMGMYRAFWSRPSSGSVVLVVCKEVVSDQLGQFLAPGPIFAVLIYMLFGSSVSAQGCP